MADSSKIEQQDTQETEGTQDDTTVDPTQESAETSSEEQETQMLQEARDTFGIPDDWTDPQLSQWLNQPVDEQRGVKTDTDVFRFDPTRANRAANTWPTVELEAFLHGDLDGVSPKRVPELVAEYRRRVSLETAWSDQQVLDYFRKDITPEQTSTGAWLFDRTRPNRGAGDWSTEELEAWALGEIKAVGKVTDAKLAGELRRRLGLRTDDETVTGVIKAYHNAKATEAALAAEPAPEPQPAPEPTPTATHTGALTEMNLSFIDGVLDRYVAAVGPNKMVGEAEGGKAQRDLDNLFNYVMRLEGAAMPEALDMIKKRIIKERNGVFSPSLAYRFTHLLKGDRKHQQRHVNLIELFLIVTDRQAAAKRKQVDIRHMLNGFPPAVVERLTDYFQNYA